MEYPKTIELNDAKLEKLIMEKSKLVESGRSVSVKIEEIEKQMEEIDVKIQNIESTVDISDIEADAEAKTIQMKAVYEEMQEIQNKIYGRMKEKVPVELTQSYDELKKNKEELEEERNKIALKAQKYTDKIIPLARKAMQPHLVDKHDDFEGIKIEDGKLIGKVFNHLEEFKSNFDKKKA